MANFQGNLCLDGLPLTSSRFVLVSCNFLGQAKTFHLLFNTVPPCLPVKFSWSNSCYTFDANDVQTASVYLLSPDWLVLIQTIFVLHFSSFLWLCGTVVERRSLTGELSLSCARPAADGRVTTYYVDKPSAVGQPTWPTQPFILSG